MENNHISWRIIAFIGVTFLVIFALLMFLVVMPEKQAIRKEIDRLETTEALMIEAIASGNNKLARSLIDQLNWQYEASTTEGIEISSLQKQIWNKKRNEYLQAIKKEINNVLKEEKDAEFHDLHLH